jgi:hypothetical protein
MNEILRPGKYYLGCPSVLPNSIYTGIWGNVLSFATGKHLINDCDFAVYYTHYGDGKFTDSKLRDYEITSGAIALIQIELISDISLCKKHGHIFEFTKPVRFIYDAGIFHIKSDKKLISINTRILDEYESDMEDHCKDENNEYITKVIENCETESVAEEDKIYGIDNENSDSEIEDDENSEQKKTIENVDLNMLKKSTPRVFFNFNK